MDIASEERLIVAPDVDSYAEALQLFMTVGLTIVRCVVDQGKKVFLDLKIDHTPRTTHTRVRLRRRNCIGNFRDRLRREFPKLLIVTPGIRLGGAGSDDHNRSMTQFKAIQAGANYLVVGRPIRASDDPKGIAREIQEQIELALRRKAS